MKKITLGFLMSTYLIFFFSCTESIGNLSFESNVENLFSVYVPEAGTFNFKQNYSPTTEIDDIETSLKISSNSIDNDILTVELLGFKESILKYSNLAFTFRDTIAKNQSQYKIIDDNGGILLNNNLININVLNPSEDDTNISGHYEGICKITTLDGDGVDGAIIIFSMYGNINSGNKLLLFPTDDSTGIDYVSGTYNLDNAFSGIIYKDNMEIGTVSNTMTDFIYNSTEKSIIDKLNIATTDNVMKRLDLTIQKTN